MGAALLFFCVGLMMGALVAEAKPRKDKLTLHTDSGAHVIEIEIAETEADKSLGLMYRPKVPPNTGMLFPYGRPQELTMWMRNTYASLDMVFIKADGSVHRIEYSTEPLSERIIASRGPVVAVLELAAGEAKRLRIKPGDRVEHASLKSAK
jgi:uncharacterized membrane protein (UPF0127 family)